MAETKSLITELPKIIERGKKQAERILDNLSKKNKITLQTNELVLPTKAKGGVIHNGEVIGIVGPNATGKTTFVKMLAGNIKPSKGNVTSVKVSYKPQYLIPDYDGEVFRGNWQDYRQNTENNNDPYRVIKKTKLDVPKVKGERKVCVKAVDVFGFESVAVREVR